MSFSILGSRSRPWLPPCVSATSRLLQLQADVAALLAELRALRLARLSRRLALGILARRRLAGGAGQVASGRAASGPAGCGRPARAAPAAARAGTMATSRPSLGPPHRQPTARAQPQRSAASRTARADRSLDVLWLIGKIPKFPGACRPRAEFFENFPVTRLWVRLRLGGQCSAIAAPGAIHGLPRLDVAWESADKARHAATRAHQP